MANHHGSTKDDKVTAYLDEQDASNKQRADTRLKAGRYTLEEAAIVISKAAGAGYEAILGKLIRAAESYSLRTYMCENTAPNEYGRERGQWAGPDPYFDECYWGELNKWLKTEMPHVDCEFPEPADTPANMNAEGMQDAKRPLKKPPLQQKFQEQEILRVIRELSYDPRNLPKREVGKSGVKAEVRQRLDFPVKVFDKAWERLRVGQDIQDSE